MRHSFLIIFTSLLACNAQALDPNDAKALQQTQDVMTDKTKREQVLKGSEKAKKADDYVKSVGGQHTEDIYALAAKVFEKLVKKYNGDAEKINEVLEQAKKDPAAFANAEFTVEELSALKTLSEKIEPLPPSNK